MKSKRGDRLEATSVMWPFWTSTKHNSDGDQGCGYVLFPFFGHAHFTNQETWMFLPPLFRFTDSRKDGKSGNFPWPFIQYSAANPEKFYVWPVWGYKKFPGVESSFFLWPIIHQEKVERPDVQINRFSVIPFVFYESTATISKMECLNDIPVDYKPVTDRYFHLWPLGSYCRSGENSRFRTLDMWPAKQAGGIERNWAPFWTLYSHLRSGQNSEDELLWGLYRVNKGENNRRWSIFPLFSWETSTDKGGSKEWNLFMGFFGYKREDLLKTYRMLYFFKFRTNKEELAP